MGCHALFQGNFLTQGFNLCPLQHPVCKHLAFSSFVISTLWCVFVETQSDVSFWCLLHWQAGSLSLAPLGSAEYTGVTWKLTRKTHQQMHKGYEESIHQRGNSKEELASAGVPRITSNQTTWTTEDIRMLKWESWKMPGVCKHMGWWELYLVAGWRVNDCSDLTILVRLNKV